MDAEHNSYDFEDAAEVLRTLAHPHRLHIVELLLEGDKTVGELADSCGIASSVASEHLRRLRDRGILNRTRDGRSMYYSIRSPGLDSVIRCVRNGLSGERAS